MIDFQRSTTGWSWWYLLFLVEFLLVLWPPLYNFADPSWAGIPFFYWYQLACVIAGAVLTAIVYFATETGGNAERVAPAGAAKARNPGGGAR